MAETAHHVTRVPVIVGMATERGIQAELPALLGAADILVNGVHGFQNTAGQFLEFAKFHRFVHAVVLEVIEPFGGLESVRSGDGQPIHVR